MQSRQKRHFMSILEYRWFFFKIQSKILISNETWTRDLFRKLALILIRMELSLLPFPLRQNLKQDGHPLIPIHSDLYQNHQIRGNRLGKEKPFQNRILARNPRARKCGSCPFSVLTLGHILKIQLGRRQVLLELYIGGCGAEFRH